MSTKSLLATLALIVALSGCAEFNDWIATTSAGNAPAQTKAVEARADAVYVNSDEAAGSRDFRNVYIAPANLANMQVIQPEGAIADMEWWVTDAEASVLQQAITEQFAAALGYGSAFYIVQSPEEAQIVVDTAVVAINPNITRAAVASRSSSGGAVTVSVALVNARNGAVLVRVVDTKATDDIWAFNQVEAGDPAFNPIFRAWGDSMRQGLLQLQGR